MDFIVEKYTLTGVEPPPGVNVWFKFTGRLTSVNGVRFELGRYTCPHVIEKGHGWVRAGNQIKEMRPGDMFCIMQDGEIEYYDDPGDPWIFCWMHIFGEDADRMMRSWGFTPEKPWFRPNRPERVLEGFNRIRELAEEEEKASPNLLAAELFKLADILDRKKVPVRSRNRQLADYADALIEANMHTGLNVSELAETMRVDRTTLFNVFKSELGCSPVDYIRKQRIVRACSMLRDSNMMIADIARLCGFNSDKYFIRTFKQIKGVTPGQFRDGV